MGGNHTTTTLPPQKPADLPLATAKLVTSSPTHGYATPPMDQQSIDPTEINCIILDTQCAIKPITVIAITTAPCHPYPHSHTLAN